MGDDLEQLAQVFAGALHEERPEAGTKPGPGPGAEPEPVVPAGGQDGGGKPNQELKSKDPTQKDWERAKQKGGSVFLDAPPV